LLSNHIKALSTAIFTRLIPGMKTNSFREAVYNKPMNIFMSAQEKFITFYCQYLCAS